MHLGAECSERIACSRDYPACDGAMRTFTPRARNPSSIRSSALASVTRGYAAAAAYALFMATLVITYLQFRLGDRYAHYRR
jgi:hypothetical protein